MDYKQEKDSLNHLSQEKNLPATAPKNSMLQFQQQNKKKKIYVIPVVIATILFVSCLVFIFSLFGESKQIATENDVTQLDSQSIVHYSLEVNGIEVPKDGQVEIAINGEQITIGIVQKQPTSTDHSKYTEEELAKAYLSGNTADHFVDMDETIWKEYGAEGDTIKVVGFQTKNLQLRDHLTVSISDELKNRLQLVTNTITITTFVENSNLPEDIVIVGQQDEALKEKLQQEIRSLYALNDDGTNLVHSVFLKDRIAVIDFTDDFVKFVKPTLSSDSKRELERTIQKVMLIGGEIDSIHFGINGDYNAWWNLME
ncbi:hypothetical protein [Lysinibacillus sp. 54212]|uniref:hypothetical protein n=1 Tax=Lysinibacillus sp. 54212 TaxID=3119829 RepID=UPI002FC691AA